MSQRPRRVFILEDDKAMRQSLRMLIDLADDLEVCGEAARGADALEQLPKCEPDLVLIDLTLPDMSGLDFVREVVASNPEIVTLVISGHRADQFADAAIDAGASGYVQKGLAGQFYDAMRAVLRGEAYTTGG
jgi:DNA-binding NarL/FixJ family response regulator